MEQGMFQIKKNVNMWMACEIKLSNATWLKYIIVIDFLFSLNLVTFYKCQYFKQP